MQAPSGTYPLVHIGSMSMEGLGLHLSALSLEPFSGSSQSVTWPTANKAIYVPIVIERPIFMTGMWCMTGATSSGNVDIGLYTKDGTRIISSGATTQANTSNAQLFNTTDKMIGVGDFYLGLSLSGTTGTVRACPSFTQPLLLDMCGVKEQASAHALPANATFATNTFTWVPFFGLTGRAIV